jgi:hypothetical protein
MNCINCDREVPEAKYAKYCVGCRAALRTKKTKYIFNERMDECIKRAYTERLDKRSSAIPGLKQLATDWNIPHYALKRRADALNLTHTKSPKWKEEELAIITKFAWMPTCTIVKKLQNQGFKRSANAVKLKLQRQEISRIPETDQYTARGVAECFGIDNHTVISWIDKGWLKADLLRVDNKKQRFFTITEKQIKEFIFNHPMAFSLRKVDQLWFMDLITEGKSFTATNSVAKK